MHNRLLHNDIEKIIFFLEQIFHKMIVKQTEEMFETE